MTTETQQNPPAATPPAATPPTTDLGNPPSESKPSQQPATPESSPSSPSTASSGSPAETDLGADDKTPPAESKDTDLGTDDKSVEPPVEKTPAELRAEAAAAFHGAPDGEADYEFVAPDGMVVDADLAAEFSPIAKELNLNQAGAQKLIDLKIADNRRVLERWGNHLGELRTEAKADPEIGGSKYDSTLARARDVLKQFGTPELRKAMNHYGIGAHKEMIRFLSRIAAKVGEPAPSGNGDGAVVEKKPLHEVLYK